MPLEIKELHIKASVSDEAAKNSGEGDGSTGSNDANQELIAACIDRITEILKDKMER